MNNNEITQDILIIPVKNHYKPDNSITKLLQNNYTKSPFCAICTKAFNHLFLFCTKICGFAVCTLYAAYMLNIGAYKKSRKPRKAVKIYVFSRFSQWKSTFFRRYGCHRKGYKSANRDDPCRKTCSIEVVQFAQNSIPLTIKQALGQFMPVILIIPRSTPFYIIGLHFAQPQTESDRTSHQRRIF